MRLGIEIEQLCLSQKTQTLRILANLYPIRLIPAFPYTDTLRLGILNAIIP